MFSCTECLPGVTCWDLHLLVVGLVVAYLGWWLVKICGFRSWSGLGLPAGSSFAFMVDFYSIVKIS